MKKILSALVVFAMVVAAPVYSFAEDVQNTAPKTVPKTVRVGLEYKYKEVASVPIYNKNIEIGGENNGNFAGEVVLSATGNFFAVIPTTYYATLNQNYTSYNDAKSSADNLVSKGYSAVPAYISTGNWKVYISGAATVSEAEFTANELSAGGNEASAVSDISKIVVIKDGNNPIVVSGGENIQISASDNGGILNLGDRSYRDVIEFGRYKGKNITAVNVVDMQHYLYGVVPSEMPQTYEMEALKAQAVAARTYAVTKLGAHIGEGYQLCDSISCQVYLGYGNEAERTRSAVDETDGVAIYYEGNPIEAVFCASSGGYTENAGNVWVNSTPYLLPVEDPYEFETDSWTRTFTAGEINSLLQSNGISIGSIQKIETICDSQSGRVQTLKFTGTSGTKAVTKENIKSFFGPIGGSLKSRMFTVSSSTTSASNTPVQQTTKTIENSQVVTSPDIVSAPEASVEDLGVVKLVQANDDYVIGSDENIYISDGSGVVAVENGSEINYTEKTTYTPVTSSSASGNSYVFSGRGNGHGVGMSQKGANGMAKNGSDYNEILQHYYTGVEVK